MIAKVVTITKKWSWFWSW